MVEHCDARKSNDKEFTSDVTTLRFIDMCAGWMPCDPPSGWHTHQILSKMVHLYAEHQDSIDQFLQECNSQGGENANNASGHMASKVPRISTERVAETPAGEMVKGS